MSGFLHKIMEMRRHDVEQTRAGSDFAQLRSTAHSVRSRRTAFGLNSALNNSLGPNIIAEIKRASPSKGVINDNINVAGVARDYESGGAIAISVLTEPEYFKGSLDDLRVVSSSVSIPILRKDFTVDEFQIYEAAAAGADAVLLIVAALELSELERFCKCASELQMDALFEVHNEKELETAISVGAQLIGVNNRDLSTLDVSLNVSRRLIRSKPVGIRMISESGITSGEEIIELRSLGFDGFLIGETLMRLTSASATLRTWTSGRSV